MNKSLKKFLACLLTAALVLGAVPVQADAAAAKPKLNVSSKTLTVGSKTTLKVKNKVKGSKYTWSAGNKKVAAVTKKGVVKAVNPGNTTITCKVKAPKKTYTLKCKIKVTGAVTAATQKSLDKALKNSKVTKITLKTTAAKKFTIQAGNYGKKTLVVDAPNADVTNNGVFKSITIKNIKPSTWTEKAKGNKLKVTAAKAGIVIDKNASVSKLTFVKTDGEAKVEINGQVENVTVLKKAKINITVNGEVKKVSVEAPAAVAVGGTAEKVPVTITEKAAGASIEASVPVIAKVKANVSISLKKGAEGTTIDKTGKTVKVTVDNKTAQAVLVTTDGKNGERVESGRQSVIGGETNTDNTTTPDNGNSGGGSSNSGSKPSKPDVKVTSVSVKSATQIKVIMGQLEGLTFAVTGNDYKGTVSAAYAEGAYTLTLSSALENEKEYTLTISKTGYTSYTAAISWNETASKPDLKVDGVFVESATQVKVTMEELEGITFTVTGNDYAGTAAAAYAADAYTLTLSDALAHGKEYTLTISREGYTSYTAAISWDDTAAFVEWAQEPFTTIARGADNGTEPPYQLMKINYIRKQDVLESRMTITMKTPQTSDVDAGTVLWNTSGKTTEGVGYWEWSYRDGRICMDANGTLDGKEGADLHDVERVNTTQVKAGSVVTFVITVKDSDGNTYSISKDYTITENDVAMSTFVSEEEITTALAAINAAADRASMKTALEENYIKLGLAMAEGSDYATLFDVNKNVVIDAVVSGKSSTYTTVEALVRVFNEAVTAQTKKINEAEAGIGEGAATVVYDTLQSAITAAEGEAEAVTINILNPIKTDVVIATPATGSAANKIIIKDAKTVKTENTVSISVKRPNVELNGLSISVPASGGAITMPNNDRSAVVIGASNVTVTNCTINTVDNAIGIIINRTTEALTDIRITNNTITTGEGSCGIYIPQGTTGTITGNTITGSAAYPIGMQFDGNLTSDTLAPEITSNTFSTVEGKIAAYIIILGGTTINNNFASTAGGIAALPTNLKKVVEALVKQIDNTSGSKVIQISQYNNDNTTVVKREKYDYADNGKYSYKDSANAEWVTPASAP